MDSHSKVPEFKDRFFGIAVLVAVQFIIGFIHGIFGFTMLACSFSVAAFSITQLIYSIYTTTYGLLTLFFTYPILEHNRLGWIGTVVISLFVIIADILTLLSLFTILGIPEFAAIGEIPYSTIVLGYLFQPHVKAKYRI
ncbi:hypothetical protein E2P30_00905 [Candidatus Bathyarchaeota archaeon]|nr:hypothetical protein E2P30_00905 [Candidatus Bathyarchaeota archaeon]